MPKLAQRNAIMPSSPIRKLMPYAFAAARDGIQIYHLNIGQPDLPTPQQYFTAIQDAMIQTLSYSPSEGYLSYREGLADYYKRFDVNVHADDIIVTTGGSEALQFIFLSCFDPGDELIVPEPFYANYNAYAAMFGVEIIPLPTRLDENFALPPVEAFEDVITERTKGILICNPSNPTGKVFEAEGLEKLEEIVLKHDLFLISDEVYKEFLYDGREFKSVLSLKRIQQQAIMVDSISKRWSACGARLGNLVTMNRDVRAAAMKYAQARLSPPTFAQIGARALFDLPDSYYQDIRQQYVKRRDLVISMLNDIPGVKCPESGGAFYVMAELPVDDVETFCIWLLEEFSHDGATVMIAPGNGFYATPGSGNNQARIAYVLEPDNLRHAMTCLRVGLERYLGHH